MASAVNDDVARAGGLIAVAVLPSLAGLTGYSYPHPASFSHGLHVAVVVSGALCALAGAVAAIGLRQAREPLPSPVLRCCPVDGPPATAVRG